MKTLDEIRKELGPWKYGSEDASKKTGWSSGEAEDENGDLIEDDEEE